MSEELLIKIYNSFDPFYPLDAVKDADIYVDMSDSRGGADIKRDLGKKIIRSRDSRPMAQLYTGHRGTGKSTELLRLKKYLEEKECYVVYFAADDGDIDPEDAQYTDVLIACTRQLLNELKYADQSKFRNWVESRVQELKDLALAEVDFDGGKVDIPLMFTQMSMAIRKIPRQRAKIRKLIDPNTVTLLEILKEFIADAKKKLPNDKKQLVVIVDNLDRIVPMRRDDGRSNHEEIFIDRSEQLKDLGCDVVYTVPISIAYNRANDLAERYDGEPSILPITAIRTLAGNEDPESLAELKRIIDKRVHRYLGLGENFGLIPDIFAEAEVLKRLCLMSGGHVRDLLRLVRTSFDYIDELPITQRAAQYAITQTRDIYRRSVTSSDEWLTLARVAKDKQIKGDDIERRLLFSRCILQYAALDEEDEMQTWYDVHPLILMIQQFQSAQQQLLASTKDLVSPLIQAMDESERLYFKLLDQNKFSEAAEVASSLHESYEEVAQGLSFGQEQTEDYQQALVWSNYWKIRKEQYNWRKEV